jgi:hypothetical protein
LMLMLLVLVTRPELFAIAFQLFVIARLGPLALD